MPREGRHAGGVLRGDAVSTLVSGRLRVYLWIGAVAVVAELLVRRPEPLIVGAPFILAVSIGLALARPPRLEVAVRLDRDRAVEGEEVELEVWVTSVGAIARLEIELGLPRGLAASPSEDGPSGLRAGATRTFRRRLQCRRGGGRPVGGGAWWERCASARVIHWASSTTGSWSGGCCRFVSTRAPKRCGACSGRPR